MVTQNTNPFVLPGFGQSGETAANPLLASMEMMRKAWEGLAGASGFDSTFTAPGSTPEDLERRIADLRAVENWLRMNLSMLSSTIQALEVQRSTLATLQAFVASAGGTRSDTAEPSPLDVALGIRRGSDVAPSADSSGLFGGAAAAPASSAGATPAGAASASATPPSDTGNDAGASDTSASAPAAPVNAVMQSWWDMLQTQFDHLASATSASFQGAEALKEAAETVQKQAMESTREATEALKKTAAAGTAPAKKTTAKKAAKKAAPRKTAAKKTAARKTAGKTAGAAATTASTTTAAVKKTAVKKAAAKKSPAKKTATKKSAAKKTVKPDSSAENKS